MLWSEAKVEERTYSGEWFSPTSYVWYGGQEHTIKF